MPRKFLLALMAPLFAAFAVAQTSDMTRVPAQMDVGAIPLYDGQAPGSEGSEVEEIWTDVGTERWVRNVTQPTLLPVLPDDETATGAAVIVIPGGGFQFVSIDNEGYPIAEWLADQGVAAFVLKYRVMETPAPEDEFAVHMQRMFSPTPETEPIDVSTGIPLAVADAQAALKLVEARSAEWGIDTGRIGLLGFSAGAITSLGVVLEDSDAPHPDFIGYIYGPMTAVEVPGDAPPLFAALAANDSLFGDQGFGLVESWMGAGGSAELHVYESGGHGFGSYKRGVTADGWFDQFMRWMTARGLLETAEPE
ncbi:alpha/beta hydrolase [Hyphomonas sp.]|uniref:alpha/beta hydrolase n=1 Tax=Hyphomonas sp. TaxID=87 RepID=UPI003001AF63